MTEGLPLSLVRLTYRPGPGHRARSARGKENEHRLPDWLVRALGARQKQTLVFYLAHCNGDGTIDWGKK